MKDEREISDLPLGPYRVLDLTEGGFNWCGKVLADLGADVIKVEPPQGSPTRSRGPFYLDDPNPERSLFWYAYCLNKRGITLDLETRDGHDIFTDLVRKSDFVIESYPPGYLDELGLGYDSLSCANPGLIMTSISPNGQTGPHAQHKAPDIVAWSMGGMQHLAGDTDRPPVRIGFPQAELNAGAQAAAGSMVAFWHRQRTGEGQHVDVSMQVAVIWTLMSATAFPPLHNVNLERAGAYRTGGAVRSRGVFPCKDGYVSVVFNGSGFISPMVRWMEEEGVTPEFMALGNWDSWTPGELSARGDEGLAELRALEQHIGEFLITKTKVELFQRALEHRILLAPCNTVQDIWESPQLKARGFWTQMHHPDLDASLTYTGPFIKFSETPIRTRHLAPRLGQHNYEVFVTELGLAEDRMTQLQAQGVI